MELAPFVNEQVAVMFRQPIPCLVHNGRTFEPAFQPGPPDPNDPQGRPQPMPISLQLLDGILRQPHLDKEVYTLEYKNMANATQRIKMSFSPDMVSAVFELNRVAIVPATEMPKPVVEGQQPPSG